MKKIETVDELFVVDDKAGVIGEFAMKYVELAKLLNKKVRRLSEVCPDWRQTEGTRQSVFKEGMARTFPPAAIKAA